MTDFHGNLRRNNIFDRTYLPYIHSVVATLSKTFETVLMCDSSKDQANEFSEKQCLDMRIENIKLDVSLKLSLSVDKMTKRDLLKEPGQLVDNNVDVDSNDDREKANL